MDKVPPLSLANINTTTVCFNRSQSNSQDQIMRSPRTPTLCRSQKFQFPTQCLSSREVNKMIAISSQIDSNKKLKSLNRSKSVKIKRNKSLTHEDQSWLNNIRSEIKDKYSLLMLELSLIDIIIKDFYESCHFRISYQLEITDMKQWCDIGIKNTELFMGPYNLADSQQKYIDMLHRFEFIKLAIENQILKNVLTIGNIARNQMLNKLKNNKSKILLSQIINSTELATKLQFKPKSPKVYNRNVKYYKNQINTINIPNRKSHLYIDGNRLMVKVDDNTKIISWIFEIFGMTVNHIIFNNLIINISLWDNFLKYCKDIKSLKFINCKISTNNLELDKLNKLRILMFSKCGDLTGIKFGKSKPRSNVYQLKIRDNTVIKNSQMRFFKNVKSLYLDNNIDVYKNIPGKLMELCLKADIIDLTYICQKLNCYHLTKLKIISRTDLNGNSPIQKFIIDLFQNRAQKLEYLKLINVGFQTYAIDLLLRNKTCIFNGTTDLKYLHIGTTHENYFADKVEVGEMKFLFRLCPKLEYILIQNMMILDEQVVELVTNLPQLCFIQLPEKIYLSRKRTEYITNNYNVNICIVDDQHNNSSKNLNEFILNKIYSNITPSSFH